MTEILPLTTAIIARLHDHFYPVFALLISMPRFKNINFYQNRPIIKLLAKTLQNLQALGPLPSVTLTYGCWVSAIKLPTSAPRPPRFLATRLVVRAQ